MSRLTHTVVVLLLTLGMLLPAASHSVAATPQSPSGGPATDLFFSEYIEGSSNNKALEIYNGTGSSVDLSQYSIELYTNGSSTVQNSLVLSGTVENDSTFVIANPDASDSILAVANAKSNVTFYNGDDALVLKKNGTIIDSIGQVGFDPGSAWTSNGVSTQDQTLIRKPQILSGDSNSTDPFDPSVEWDSCSINTFEFLGSHEIDEGQLLLQGCPKLIPFVQILPGQSSTLSFNLSDSTATAITGTVSVSPGINIELTNVVTSTGLYTADLTFTDQYADGVYQVTVEFTNEEGETVTRTVDFIVGNAPVWPIQGVITDQDNGATKDSPYFGQTITAQGIVYQEIRHQTSSGADRYGIFIQDSAAKNDNNPLTSDGMYVFLFSNPAVGGVNPQVGDEIVVTGRVEENFNMTQLNFISSIQVLTSGIDIETAVPPFQATPPADRSAALRYWERREGMRAQVVQGSIVQGGRDVFGGTDGELWTAPPTVDFTDCASPYAERTFRDAHPCDNTEDLFDDGNGYLVLLSSFGLKATTGMVDTLIAPGRTFDVVQNTPTGGVYYSFEKYMIQITEQPQLQSGLNPAENAPPSVPDRSLEFSVATFNVENLYDFRDDPFDECDFFGNAGTGCGTNFNYVPESQAAYDAHLTGLALQVVNDLYSPEILMIQEAEDQDICTVSGSTLDCGTTNNRDGRPDTLQDLALRIQQLGGPQYAAAYDRNGADDRGIVSAFMYRTDAGTFLDVDNQGIFGSQNDLVTTSYISMTGFNDVTELAFNNDTQNPKAFNATLTAQAGDDTDGSNIFTRAPVVAKFWIYPGQNRGGSQQAFYVVNNHFSSGPDRRVGQRAEQANYNAAIVEAIETLDPNARVLVGGDLNVFPRPDDPFAPGDPLFPTDQLGGLYEQGMTNLWSLQVEQVPASAYSYVFNGQAQTLDQIFVNDNALNRVGEIRTAHINADWPAENFFPPVQRGVPTPVEARGVSDHDPNVAQFFFFPADLTGSSKIASSSVITAGDTLTYTIRVLNSGGVSTSFELTDTLDPALNLISTDMISNGRMLSATGTVSPSSALTYTIVVQVSPLYSGTLTNTAFLSTMTMSGTLESVVVVNQNTTPMADFSQSGKTVSSQNVMAGELFTYTIELSNTGELSGSYMLTDTLDPNLTVVSTTLSGTNPLTAMGDLDDDDSMLYTIVVSTTAAFSGTIDNTAVLEVNGFQYDLNAPAVQVTTMPTTADISGTKTVNTSSIMAGNVFTYTIRVVNNGEDLGSYMLTDTLDPNLTMVSTSLSGTNPLTAAGDLDAGESMIYTIAVSTTAEFSGTINNSAMLNVDGMLMQLTAPAVQVVNQPSGMAMLGAEKLVHTNTITAGELLTFTIRIQNTGAVTGSYRVTDTLNAAFTIVDPGDLAISSGNTLLGLGDVGPDSFVDYVFVVRVANDASGFLNNTAMVTGDGITTPLMPTVDVAVSERYIVYLPIVRKPSVSPGR